MAAYTNTGTSVVHVAGVMLVPGIEKEVPAEAEKLTRFKALVDAKLLVKSDAKAAAKSGG